MKNVELNEVRNALEEMINIGVTLEDMLEMFTPIDADDYSWTVQFNFDGTDIDFVVDFSDDESHKAIGLIDIWTHSQIKAMFDELLSKTSTKE